VKVALSFSFAGWCGWWAARGELRWRYLSSGESNEKGSIISSSGLVQLPPKDANESKLPLEDTDESENPEEDVGLLENSL
jgi:hypothetical protein